MEVLPSPDQTLHENDRAGSGLYVNLLPISCRAPELRVTITSPGNFHDHRAQAGHDGDITEEAAMAQDPVDIVADEVDTRSASSRTMSCLTSWAGWPWPATSTPTSILSQRWRSLPWPQIPTVSLDVGEFFRSDDDEWRVWRRSRRQHRFVEQNQATSVLTDALARFLAAAERARHRDTEPQAHPDPARLRAPRRRARRRRGRRRRGKDRRARSRHRDGDGDGDVDPDARTKLGYGERFRHFLQDCPGAFRSLTKLNLQNLWFDDPAEVNNLVRGCHALQRLSLSSCGPCPKALLLAMDDDDDDGPPRLPMLTIDAPQSRLQTLVCDHCIMGGVELVQASELVTLEYNAGGLFLQLQDYHPVSIGCAPSLQRLGLYQYQHEDSFFKLPS